MPETNEKEKLQRGKKDQLFQTWCSLERIKLFRSLICNDTVSVHRRFILRKTILHYVYDICRMNNKRRQWRERELDSIYLSYS